MTKTENPVVPLGLSPSDLGARFETAARAALDRLADVWLASLRNSLAPFESVSRDLAARIQSVAGETASLRDIWSSLELAFDAYLAWIGPLSLEKSELVGRLVLEEWDREVHGAMEDLPPTLKIPIADSFWTAGPGDNVRVRMGKWAKRRQRAIRSASLLVRNVGRKIVRKPPLPPARTSRTLDLRLFLECELALPTARFLIGEWQRFLRDAAVEMAFFHEKTEAVENESLFPGESGSAQIQEDAGSGGSRRDLVLREIEGLLERFGRIDGFKAGSLERLGESWPAIVESFQRNWEPAGTFALPNRRFGPGRNTRTRQRLIADFEAARGAWLRHFSGETQEWRKDIELCRLQLLTVRAFRETIAAVSNRTERDIVPPLESALTLIKRYVEGIKAFRPSSKGDLKKLIAADAKSLADELRRDRLPVVVDALAGAELDTLLGGFPSSIGKALEALPPRYEIFVERDLESLAPRSKIDEAPVRDLAFDDIYPRLAKETEALVAEIGDLSDDIFRDIAEIDQIVDYNSESALALLEERKGPDAVEAAHRLAGEGLERAAGQAAALIAKTRSMAALASERLAASSAGFIDRLQDLENSEKITRMKLRYARAQAKQKMRASGIRAWAKGKASFAVVIASARTSLGRAKTAYLRLRKLSGLTPRAIGLEEKLALFLHRTQGRISSLPYVYQRLFRIEPLTDKRFYIGREEDKAHLNDSLRAWRSGQYAATALVGEKGSGKTTILNFAEIEYFQGQRLLKIDLVNTTVRTTDELLAVLRKAFDHAGAESLAALERDLLAGEDKVVCVLENMQNMFLRTVGGFEALERFLLFVTRTNAAVLWIVTCTLYSWNFFDKVFQVSKYFKQVVTLGTLTRGETADLILKRHRISGYPLRFDIPEPQAQPRKFKKLTQPDAQQAFLRDWFFDQLNRLSSGNVAVAMWFWMGAIKSIDQQGLTVTPVIDLDYSFLQQLGNDETFTLGALLQHETLTAEEHALIFHQGLDESLLLLNRLVSKKYITVAEGRYAIHPLLYRPSVAALKAKNIVH